VRDRARHSFEERDPGAAGAAAAAGIAVRRLVLGDFRSYAALRLELDARPVALSGPNGAGKTNLLEALSFLAPGRGLRRARLEEVGRTSAPKGAAWTVAASVATAKGTLEIGTGRDPEAEPAALRRLVRIDGRPARSQGELARHLTVLWVTPEMDRLFQEGASARRRFLDRMVYGLDAEHAARLAAYEHALRERARLLREGASDATWLDALENTMAETGVAIAAARRRLVRRLARALEHARGPFPAASVELEGTLEAWLDEGPALAAEERFRALLASARSEDALTGRAKDGPQRSDLVVRHLGSGLAAALASTGEQKALLLSLVLAHARLEALERGAVPLLLLDEVGAHLDRVRRQALFDELLAFGSQVWLSGTEEAAFESLGAAAQQFRVVDGNVVLR